MIRLGICEDDKEQAQEIGEMAEKILFHRTEYALTYYDSGEKLLEAIDNKQYEIDLLLLDIRMNQVNGLQTAEYIRRNSVDTDIIFVTASSEHVYEGYVYKAFSYLLKPVVFERLEKELNRYLDEKENTSQCLQVSFRGTVQKIQLDKVYYFESNARKIMAYQQSEDIEFYNKLDALEEMLKEKGFWRCHQSYLVNEKYVSSVSREHLVVKDVDIPMSRKYYEQLKKENRFQEQGVGV